MFSSVTNWLGVNIKGKDADPSEENKENQGEVAQPHSESKESISSTSVETSTSSKSLPESDSEECKSTSEEESSQDSSALHTLEDVSSKAINTAKEFGSILFNFGKAAGKTVAEQASKLKTTVEEKTMLGDFNREQEKFVTEKKENKKQEEAAVPPWVGYNEEETMKNQILALSLDKRNFLRNPPAGVKYQFDFATAYPIALATLQEDPNLQKMRFELVPKKTSEENFWRNYFYRVSLIKQSTQLTSLTHQETVAPAAAPGGRRTAASRRRRKRPTPVPTRQSRRRAARTTTPRTVPHRTSSSATPSTSSRCPRRTSAARWSNWGSRTTRREKRWLNGRRSCSRSCRTTRWWAAPGTWTTPTWSERSCSRLSKRRRPSPNLPPTHPPIHPSVHLSIVSAPNHPPARGPATKSSVQGYKLSKHWFTTSFLQEEGAGKRCSEFVMSALLTLRSLFVS